MRAVVRERYGSPDVLELRDVPMPTIADDEVLVRVVASSLNASDAEILRGDAFVRMGGPRGPQQSVLGSDIAGVIETVGPAVTTFRAGDEVVADLMASNHFGALAEYAVAPERVLVAKPAGVTFEDAATLPQAAILALQALRWRREASAGERVLINGAGGGVGTFAVQLARSLGAEVTAVDVAAKLEGLRSLGADHVIDHTTWSPDRVEEGYDRIIDVIARRSVLAWRHALRPGGAYLVIGGSAARILGVATVGTLASGRSKTMRLLVARLGDRDDIATVLGMAEAGTLRPVIDRMVGLEEVPDAFRRLMAGAVFGKVVVRM